MHIVLALCLRGPGHWPVLVKANPRRSSWSSTIVCGIVVFDEIVVDLGCYVYTSANRYVKSIVDRSTDACTASRASTARARTVPPEEANQRDLDETTQSVDSLNAPDTPIQWIRADLG